MCLRECVCRYVRCCVYVHTSTSKHHTPCRPVLEATSLFLELPLKVFSTNQARPKAHITVPTYFADTWKPPEDWG